MIADTISAAGAIGDESPPGATSEGGHAPERADDFTLSLLWQSGRCLPTPGDALRELDLGHVKRLRLIVRCSDPLQRWGETAAWIVGLEQYLVETRARIELDCHLHTVMPDVPARFFDFIAPRLARLTLVVTDTGKAGPGWRALAERAARLADWGMRIRPKVCLTRLNLPHWEERAQTWRTVCRAAGVSFSRPHVNRDRPEDTLARLPATAKVAEFFASIYDGKMHDLAESYPFSHLLRALSAGTASVPRCGSPSHLAIDCDGHVLACEHRSRVSPGGPPRACSCAYGPFCDALGSPCQALRDAAATERWRDWERLFCPAVGLLLPKMVEDLALAARFQAFLMSCPADERFRLTSGDGIPRVARQRVEVDARNSFPSEDAHEHTKPA